MREYERALTPEDLIRRYDLENLKKDRKATQNNKQSITKTDALLREFIKTATDDMNAIKNQVDGKITTWFFDGEPTTENEPAVNWKTDEERNTHLGDLYYDKNTGYSYRWSEDSGYKWIKIIDSAANEALAIANAAKDTADSKRRVFVVTPYPPYDVGDIWFKEDKDIYRCRSSRKNGEYNSIDWCEAVDYTDDTYAKNVEAVLNQFKTTVEEDYTTKVQLETTKDSIVGAVEATTKKIETTQQNIYDELTGKLDRCETVENVTVIKQKVEEMTTSTEKVINIINDIQTNGVTQLDTKTGFTFGIDGLIIDKYGAKTGTRTDEAGTETIDKTGVAEKTLQYTGYVDSEMSKKNDTLKRYEGQTVSYAANFIFENFFASKNFRFEEEVDEQGTVWFSLFYTGGE